MKLEVTMWSCLQLLLGLAVASCTPLAAAQTATTTSSVNVRAGPERMFPSVTSLLSGTSVAVVGCVDNWRWCDVIAGRDRGWVYTRFLSYPFRGSAVTMADGGPNLGLKPIEFSLGSYLGRALPDPDLVWTKALLAKPLGPAAAIASVAGVAIHARAIAGEVTTFAPHRLEAVPSEVRQGATSCSSDA